MGRNFEILKFEKIRFFSNFFRTFCRTFLVSWRSLLWRWSVRGCSLSDPWSVGSVGCRSCSLRGSTERIRSRKSGTVSDRSSGPKKKQDQFQGCSFLSPVSEASREVANLFQNKFAGLGARAVFVYPFSTKSIFDWITT